MMSGLFFNVYPQRFLLATLRFVGMEPFYFSRLSSHLRPYGDISPTNVYVCIGSYDGIYAAWLAVHVPGPESAK
jgi:hypothetical protein